MLKGYSPKESYLNKGDGFIFHFELHELTDRFHYLIHALWHRCRLYFASFIEEILCLKLNIS